MDETFTPEVEIDRDSETPLYEQIAQPIEEAILSGDLAPGAKIEDEVSMAQRLEVARPTARRALQELTEKGLLLRRRGVGTTVTAPHAHRPMRLTSLDEDLARAGFTPSTKVLGYEIREANDDECSSLGLEPGDSLLSLRRLRYADGTPVAILNNLVPLELAPIWQELADASLFDCLRARDVEVTIVEQEIGARCATAEEAELLEAKQDAAVLTLHRIRRSTGERAVDVGEHVYRPDLYSFRQTLFTS